MQNQSSNHKPSSRRVFTRLASLLAVIFIAAIFINAFPYINARAESQSSYFGLANLFGWTATEQKQKPQNVSAPFTLNVCDVANAANPIEVEATAGTTGPTAYANLAAAIAAINAGTHQGAINVEVCFNSTETAAMFLNSGDATPASYTSVNIYPLADGLTISGPSVSGRGLIELNGADNVTIDGDNPNSAGTNRNLTITNTAAATTTLTSVIRIAVLSSSIVPTANNNTFKNLNLNGSATGRNAAANTSTTASENSTFGIYAGGLATGATTAPAVLTSVSTNTAASGTTINNFNATNNTVNACARGIFFNGAASTVSTLVTIANNLVGDQATSLSGAPPYTTPTTTVYTKPIFVAGTTAFSITGNSVKNILSYVPTTANGIEINSAIGNGPLTISNNTINGVVNNNASGSPVNGIAFNSAGTGATYTVSGNTVNNIQTMAGATVTGIVLSTTATSGLVEKNKVSTVYSRGSGGFAAYGIHLSTGSAITVQNNFIWDINSFLNNSALSNQFGPFGIRIAGGLNHKIYHNSVNMFGAFVGSSSITSAAAFNITATSLTGIDVRNNIFANTMTGAPAGSSVSAIMLPSSGTSAMNLTLNNNDYYAPATIIAQVGTTAVSSYTAAAFDPSTTAGANNLRNYTSTLSAAGTNDNASKVVDPQFISNTDLHIAGASPMVDMGANVGVTQDIDNQLRVGTPDIGADEPAGVTPPANDILATAFISPVSGGTVASGVAFAPQASFTNNGTAAQTNVPVRYRILDAMMVAVCNVTTTIPSIAQNQTVTVTFPTCTVPSAGTYTIKATSELAGDQNTANDEITGTITAIAPLTGSYNVGTGGNFSSLTNPGGIFDALNAAGATGNITINITSDLTGETGSVALNQLAGGFSVTIKPSGAARSITSTASAISVIKLNDADNVTIDGSLNGGTDRSLSITNTNGAASTAAIWVASVTNGAQNNTIKNVNLAGGADQSVANVFNFGIVSSSSATITTGGTDNDNNTYTNNFVRKVSVGILSIGGLATNMNQTTTISNNLIGPATFGSDEVSTLGVLLFNENAPNVVGNEIRFIGDAATSGGSSGRDHVGISLCTGSASWSGSSAPTVTGTVTNANISRNLIHDIVDRATFSAVGIVENCANSTNPTNNNIANNMIYNILANGTSGDQTVGIGITNGNTDNVVFNSVYLTGDVDPGTATSASTSSFGISVVGTLATNLNLKNNISVMDLNSNSTLSLSHAAINLPSAAYPFGTGGSNYNDWYAPSANAQSRTGATGGSSGTFYSNLAAWQTATTQDANSKEVDPVFVSATDLHLQGTSTLINMGTPITGVTNDFDNQTRDAMPDIGADEVIVLPTVQFSAATYSGAEGTTATITVTRTGDTTGASSVNFATSDGTATGGASCGAGVDYVSTSGTLNFAASETSKTFTVTLCSDAVIKGDETVNLTLSSPTGATLGTQSTAVLTITNVNPPMPGTLALSSSTYSVGEAGGTVTITVNRTGGSDGAVSVNYGLTNGTATGGAACGGSVDYVNTGGTVNFANGETSKTFTVGICNDAVLEGNETFNVGLSGATGGATIGSPSSATVTITDDEIAQPGILALSSANYSVGEAGGTVTITVNRTAGSDGAVSVNYNLSNGTATGGASCGAGIDYINTGGTVNFANGETTKTFTVGICNDTSVEGNETFNVSLSGATGGATIGSPSSAVVTITDDDVAQPGTLALSSSTYTVGEAAGTVTVTVNRTGGTDGAVSVNYSLTNGTATGGTSCGAGVDFVNTGGTVNFANGETSKTFTVAICNDSLVEGNETFNVTLSGATGGATIGSPSTATVTITDDDVAQPGVLAFSSATYTVTENGGTATITVNRTGGSDGTVTVNYATVAGGTATGGASCGAGVDYVTTSGTLSFAGGETSKTFSITICDDTDVESSETINLALSNATGGATIGAQNTAVLTITDNDTAPTGNVVVNPGNVSYMTLGDAVTAINAGTHTGAVTVDINANTTETGPIVLNSSGAGAASYTSIVIRPTGDNITVAGPTATGRGLLELNGADNVTIDGDNPNTTGTNRNLTFQNTAANTVTFTSVIRIALATTVVNSADNDIIKNLNIVGSSTGRNIATATSTTASENTTFGILAGTGASTTAATTAPAAITSVTTGVAAGATASNLTITNNNIVTAARAVSINGTATSVFPGLLINNNTIGNPTAGDVNQVTAMGVVASGSTNAVISGNTVWIEGFVAASASTHAIDVGINSTAITGTTIEKNRVNRAQNNNGQTWTAIGINLGGGSDHLVRNNFVSGVINNQTAGTGGFGSTFGAYGIRVASGTGHKVYHNSVNLYGAMPGVTNTNFTAAFIIVTTGQTGMDVRNNIFSNQISGGNPTGTRHFAIALPASGTSAMNLTLNNNAYYQGSDALSRMAVVGFTGAGVGEYLAENFDPTSTTPATNFRAYTSTLSAAGTNDNASFATTVPPPFVSNTDLHIPAGTATRLESGGAPVGVTDDIDAETRNATTPDIGADEFAGNPPAANDIGATAILVPAPNSTLTTGTVVAPQARFTNFGSATQTNVMVQFTITGPGGYSYTDTQTIATILPNQIVTVTFANAPAFNTVGTYNMTATVLTPDSNPANNQLTGTFQVRNALSGTLTVGTGGDYTSLTNPGGIFADLNLVGASSNVVINIVSDLTAETGAVPLNQLAGGFTVTIKPSGAARTISGTAPANTGLITLNGADNVTIDGSLSGGTDRSLTITNNQTGTSTVIWIRSAAAGNGANNNTVKNCIINGATGTTLTTIGILTGSSATFGGDAEAANNNNTIRNNWIYRLQNSLYLRGGAAAANFDQNWLVTGNELGATTAGNKNSFRGMLIANAKDFSITNNVVHGVQSSATTTVIMSGIQVLLLTDGGTIANNNISDIKNVSTSGTGAYGIHIGPTSTSSNITVANNFISDVAATGSATLASNGFGINVSAGAGYKFYFNSINLNTNQTSGTTAAMLVQAAVTTAGGLDVRNNIFANTQTAGATRYSFYSGAAATVYSSIDYNDYFSTGLVGFLGTDRATLADWQSATGQDANSKAVDPLFVSASDLHLQSGSPMINAGTAIAGITTDIDGQTRDAMPDIGADEFIPATNGSLQLSSSTYSVAENGGTVTITVNRVNGSTGAVSVDYLLGSGTATGGASCGAGVDYINTGGTVNFAAGETTKTFTVQICDDSVFEGNETFSVTLTNPQGGAVLGTPSSALVTITDNDPAPPTVAINDVTVTEGNSGTTTATFTVTVTNPNASPVSVNYATANGTATAGADYVATSGTLTIPAGQTTGTISVTIIGDTIKEANETFFVNLSSPTNATIADGQGVGIIIDDDRAVVADFDGDRKSDFSVWRPGDGTWYLLPSTSQLLNARKFGQNGDKPVPGDYDGDGRTDTAVFRPSEGIWYIQRSSDLAIVAAQFGNSTDIPVQGDYNGDGRTDLAVFRPSNGTWYIARPTGIPSQNFDSIQFGQNGDVPVQGDYDGDAKTDVAVYRGGNWYVLRSSDGAFVAQQFGLGTDTPVVGDFDGDGRTDFTVYRNGTWFILQSLTGSFRAVQFGTTGDIPMAADFDGDGKADITVFRPNGGNWYLLRSSTGAFQTQQWGTNGDVPVPAAYQPR